MLLLCLDQKLSSLVIFKWNHNQAKQNIFAVLAQQTRQACNDQFCVNTEKTFGLASSNTFGCKVQNSHQPESWIIYKKRIIIICQKAQWTVVTEASALSLQTILKVVQCGIRICGKVSCPASIHSSNANIVTRCSCEYWLCSCLTRIIIALNCHSVFGQLSRIQNLLNICCLINKLLQLVLVRVSALSSYTTDVILIFQSFTPVKHNSLDTWIIMMVVSH